MFVIGSLNHIELIGKDIPELADILKLVKEIADSPFEKGTRFILDGKVKVNSEEVRLTETGQKPLEWHKYFIDIHIPVSGDEIFGWKPVDSINNITVPYDKEKDIAFSDDSYFELLKVKPGEFVVFTTDDAHAPCQGENERNHKKLCVKIPVAL